jgi:hypothetical protein
MIEASVHAMETLDKDDRHVSMAIRGVSEDLYRELCENIDRLRQEFLAAESRGKADRVVSFNAQVFPVMRLGVEDDPEETAP